MRAAPRFADRSPRFANRSEKRFSLVLDFYRVRWDYEPHTYPISWDGSGDVVASFTPDFWLPDLGVYLELTTLRQDLVTRKNRKLRLFRDRYPDKTVHLLYRRDLEGILGRPTLERARPTFHLLRA